MENKYSNKTKYNRAMHNKENPYCLISKQLINDNRLNIIEIGIMIQILSNDDTYIFNSTNFKKKLGIGDDKFNKSIKNLIKYGYIVKNKIQGGIQWTFNENTSSENTPCAFSKNTSSENIIIETNTPEEEYIPFQPTGDTEVNTYENIMEEIHNKSLSMLKEVDDVEEEYNEEDMDDNVIIDNFINYINTKGNGEFEFYDEALKNYIDINNQENINFLIDNYELWKTNFSFKQSQSYYQKLKYNI